MRVPPRRRRRSSWRRLARPFAWLLLLGFVAWVFLLPPLVQWRVRTALRAVDPVADVDVRAFSLRRLDLRHVTLGADPWLELRDVTVTYDVASLLRGRVHDVVVGGALWRVRALDGRVDWGFDVAGGGGGGDAGPGPLDRVAGGATVRDSVLVLETDKATVRVPIEARLGGPDRGARGARVDLGPFDGATGNGVRWQHAAGTVDITWNGDRVDRVAVVLGSERIALDGLAAIDIGASLQMTLTEDEIGRKIIVDPGSRLTIGAVARDGAVLAAGEPLLGATALDEPVIVTAPRTEAGRPRAAGPPPGLLGRISGPVRLSAGPFDLDAGGVRAHDATVLIDLDLLPAPGGLLGLVRAGSHLAVASVTVDAADLATAGPLRAVVSDGGARGPFVNVRREDGLRACGMPRLDLAGPIAMTAGETSFSLGRLGAEGRLCASGGGLETTVNLRASGGAVRHRDLVLDGIEATIELDRLRPLSTAGRQRLRIGPGRIGRLDIESATFAVGLDGDDLRVDAAHWITGDGARFTADAFRIDLREPVLETTVYAEAMRLAYWLPLVTDGEASGEGVLSGQLPLRVDGKHVRLGEGHLRAAPGGRITFADADQIASLLERSDPRFAVDPNMQALKRRLAAALRDYTFDRLEMSIESTEAGDRLRVHTSGRGPRGPDPQEIGGLTVNVHNIDEVVEQLLSLRFARER